MHYWIGASLILRDILLVSGSTSPKSLHFRQEIQTPHGSLESCGALHLLHWLPESVRNHPFQSINWNLLSTRGLLIAIPIFSSSFLWMTLIQQHNPIVWGKEVEHMAISTALRQAPISSISIIIPTSENFLTRAEVFSTTPSHTTGIRAMKLNSTAADLISINCFISLWQYKH